MNVPIIAVYIFLIMRLYYIYHENIKLISLLRSIVIFLSSKFIIHVRLGLSHDLYLQALQIFCRIRFQTLERGLFKAFPVIGMRDLDQCIRPLS